LTPRPPAWAWLQRPLVTYALTAVLSAGSAALLTVRLLEYRVTLLEAHEQLDEGRFARLNDRVMTLEREATVTAERHRLLDLELKKQSDRRAP
jgi:hypothetical protein